MPNWNQIRQEIRESPEQGGAAFDAIRRKYLAQLHSYTNRNIIAYYSGWLKKSGLENIEINDDDKNAFMMTVHGMDCEKGLDLFLHTPGGEVAATESIIDYLHFKFGNNIRTIVPQMAMSAGTMIACSGKSIVMGKQSSLGPIDPHLSGIPAHGVIEEFARAHKEIKEDPSKLSVWQFILQKYHPTFLSECENAISLSEEFVLKNLTHIMFKDDSHAKKKAHKIVEYLTSYKDRKTHGRHINIVECQKIGLIIEPLETDQHLQDLVLTIHHCFMHSLNATNAIKIIENHLNQAVMHFTLT
jgi:ClpP class serine protease